MLITTRFAGSNYANEVVIVVVLVFQKCDPSRFNIHTGKVELVALRLFRDVLTCNRSCSDGNELSVGFSWVVAD